MQPINTVVLSYGLSGRVFHAPFLTEHKGFNLIGAWERTNKLIQAAYPTKSLKSYDSLESILADHDPNIELIIVNTPTYTHFDYTKKCLLAKKHVLVEKAFTTTAEEAKELDDIAKTKGVKLIVFQNRRWDSDFLTIRKVLDSGVLGDLIEANLSFLRFKPEISQKGHRESPGPGAGIVKDLGAHVIDQALCLFGMPDAVFADIRNTRIGTEVDDYFYILLKYVNETTEGLSVHLKAGTMFAKPTVEYAFYGRNGSFLKSRGDVQETQLSKGILPSDADYGIEPESEKGVLTTLKEGKLETEKIDTLKGDYMKLFEGLYSCIREGGKEPVSAEEGVNVMKVIDAAFESNNNGGFVWLN